MKLGTDGVLLGAWARLPYPGASAAIDAGAGCGIVALMLAQRFPALTVTAVECDAGACADAADNFAASPWPGRLHLRHESFAVTTACTDMIVSNPPFFLTGEHAPRQSRAAARHADTLSPFTLIDSATSLLRPGGSLSFISPADQLDDIVEHAAFARLHLRRRCMVSTTETKPPRRILWEFGTADGPVEYTSLTLRCPDGSRHPDYITLCKNFYLND